jgi:hypothetical protein
LGGATWRLPEFHFYEALQPHNPNVWQDIVPFHVTLAEEIAAAIKPQPSQQQEKRGPKPRYDWEACWCELCVIVHDEGLPASQEELIKRLEGWFIDQYGVAPVRSLIQKRVKPLWDRLR